MTELSVPFADIDQLSTRAARAMITRPISGGSDLDSLIAEIVARIPMCLPCVAKKTGIAETRAAEALEHIGTFIVVQNTIAACGGCLEMTTTYRISDKTPQAEGGPAPPQPHRAALSQNGALWQFLESHRGQMFCTQCIATALFATKRIDRAVLGAEGRGARRQYGTCTSCGKERLLCGLTS